MEPAVRADRLAFSPFSTRSQAGRERAGLQLALRVALALATVGVVTWANLVVPLTNSVTAALTLLLVVLAISANMGFFEAVITSIAAAIGFGYNVPPSGQLRIDEPEDLLAFVAFMVTAIIVSRLSHEARARVEESARLRQVAERLLQTGAASAVTIEEELPTLIEEIYYPLGAIFREHGSGRMFRGAGATSEFAPRTEVAISRGTESVGTLSLIGGIVSPAITQSLSALISMALERSESVRRAVELEQSRKSDQLRSTLLAAIGHDFRSPLTTIKGAITAESNSTDVRLWTEVQSIVVEEIGRMERMLAEVIELGRVGSETVRLQRQPTPVNQLIEAAVACYGPGKERVELHLEAKDAVIDADAVRLAEALKQLLGNALLYSPADSPVQVHSSIRDAEAVVTVRDFGPGIPEAELDKVFDNFYRGSTAPAGSGFGIGLAIARSLVEAHGGHLWVESYPDEGSAFSFTIPLVPHVGGHA